MSGSTMAGSWLGKPGRMNYDKEDHASRATTGGALLEPEAASNGALLQAEAEGALLLSGLTVAIVVLVAFLLTGRRSRPPLRMPRIRSKKVASSEHAPLCILTLDGGGMKGLVLATLLEAIEERTGIPIGGLFDLVVGTSTGGVAAIHVAFASALGEGCRDYRASLERVRKVLEQRSKTNLLVTGHECTTVVTAFHEGGGWQPFLVRNYELPYSSGETSAPRSPRSYANPGAIDGESDWPIEDLVLATTAAPGLFPPVERGGKVFVDGAVVANNPTKLAIREARRRWPGRRIGIIVSLGTGQMRQAQAPIARTSSPASYWIPAMLDMAFDSNRTHADVHDTLLPAIANECGHPFYFRIQPTIEDATMVTTIPRKLAALQQQTRAFAKSMSHDLDKIAAYLLLAAARPAFLPTPAGAAEAERLCGDHCCHWETLKGLAALRARCSATPPG
ncbi:hypothetical protein EMIHUDRAFT_205017 [Emiliania huxleyi CCMP1516]|uniref:PNPLA domain-containing protein n=2 Tax=Emiliania huxleyi TaxID=2903 RepID=A0A0D3JUB7_EMIH1|nr:hypothetical protein EMIHUDRAFT_205017 [Emiliania huxleyi CCMP1516]EOD27102.1 hypothetical protein EMIHUDRAFT_205017 [Emiliania huxleyi CCMP1516]|eukprot:XP_005779531.1 hypothetical protein EMIHUDRAFT_205017 [Emiliania huxleyi CCMP1516]